MSSPILGVGGGNEEPERRKKELKSNKIIVTQKSIEIPLTLF
ncbi:MULTISPECIES: hypothetical protein [Candidatus Protochlamydia]|nr:MULTISPECIES: hypothetical protein [Protochlamydia]